MEEPSVGFDFVSASGNLASELRGDWFPKDLSFNPKDPEDVERAIRELEANLEENCKALGMTPKLEEMLTAAKAKIGRHIRELAQHLAAQADAKGESAS